MLGNINFPAPPGFPYSGIATRLRQLLQLAPEANSDPSDLCRGHLGRPELHEADWGRPRNRTARAILFLRSDKTKWAVFTTSQAWNLPFCAIVTAGFGKMCTTGGDV